MYLLEFAPDWDRYLAKMDKSVQNQILNKIEKLMDLDKSARHLRHGIPVFVIESGQYRICYEEKGNSRRVVFAGSHKQYGKWCRKQ